MKASVIITSFNHAESIGRAIESVLSQKTNFDFEVIIIDDCSKDESNEVILSYINKDKRIFYIPRDRNYGSIDSYELGFRFCQGKYIFVCECDDYWTSDEKMQRQVNYMDTNPDCGVCTHRVLTLKNRHIVDRSLPPEQANGAITYDNLLRGNKAIYAQSYCIRKTVFDEWINFSYFARHFNVFDYPIVLELIRRTRFHQLNFYGAMFVIAGESITNTTHRRSRLRLILGYAKIRAYYVMKYGCKPTTFAYLIYKFIRDIYSVTFLRWTKN